jgi:hypothetical protein
MPKIQLPPRCPRCASRDWVYAANGGVERCDCARGRALVYAATNRGRRRVNVPGVSPEQASIAVARLAGRMNFVPKEEVERTEIARELYEMVCDAPELDWLVRETPRRFRRGWPGIEEVRALYCAMFSPRDGVEVCSQIYEDGIFPGINEPAHLIADSPRGGMIAANPGNALMVRVLADAMPPPAASRKPPKSATPKPKLPTQEEIDRIKEEQRQNQKRAKAGGEPPGDEP